MTYHKQKNDPLLEVWQGPWKNLVEIWPKLNEGLGRIWQEGGGWGCRFHKWNILHDTRRKLCIFD